MRCLLVHTILAALGLVSLVAAVPQVALPLAAQQPPIVRAGSPYVFKVQPGSFTSSSAINYTVSDLPAWLNFSSNALAPTFYGEPTTADVGNYTMTVSAADASGTATSTVTLIVSSYAPPVLNLPFSEQLANEDLRNFASAITMPENSGVTVNPFWSFSLGWAGETFTRPSSGGNGRLYYAARLHDGSPLPNWLVFSNTTFTLNGVAPANGTYNVVVTGTDIWGYTGTTTSFIFAVGNGQAVEMVNAPTGVNTTARANVSSTIDTSTVRIAGQTADPSQFKITPDLTQFKWLSFNSATNTLSGTTPDSLVNGTAAPIDIPITVASTNASNTLAYETYLPFNVVPYFFSTFSVPNITTDTGSAFAYNIGPYLLNNGTVVNATVIPEEAASWLVFFPENKTLIGNPPINVTYEGIDVTFMATLNGVSATTKLNVGLTNNTEPATNANPAPVPEGVIPKGMSNTKKIIIGCIVGLGVPLLLALLLLLFCCCRKKNKDEPYRRDYSREKTPRMYSPTPVAQTPGQESFETDSTVLGTPILHPPKVSDKPGRFEAFKGRLFGGADNGSQEVITPVKQPVTSDSASFIGHGDVIAVKGVSLDRNVSNETGITRSISSQSGNSLASWESDPSFHWSGEDHYLEPMEVGGSRGPTPTARPAVVAGAAAAGAAGAAAVASQPWQRPGFYNPNFRSTDNVSYSDRFPELRDMSSRSLDSFADVGSQLGSGSLTSRFNTTSGSGTGTGTGSSGFVRGSSGLAGRFASSGLMSYSSMEEPAIVATAQRQSLETRRSSVIGPNAEHHALLVPPEPENQQNRQAVPGRRISSSRRHVARVNVTRQSIIPSGETATYGHTDDEVEYDRTADLEAGHIVFSSPIPGGDPSQFSPTQFSHAQ